jgi:hypothetical protein
MLSDKRPSLSAFARHLDLLPQTVSNWDLAKIKDRPGEDQYMKLVREFGNEVYEALDLPIPSSTGLYELSFFVPESLHRAVEEAREEYTAELASKGLDDDSPEAREIVIKAFTKRGLKVTVSE